VATTRDASTVTDCLQPPGGEGPGR
jgi:hypothetical protein